VCLFVCLRVCLRVRACFVFVLCLFVFVFFVCLFCLLVCVYNDMVSMVCYVRVDCGKNTIL
jgi:hypothetical protein